MLHVTSAYILRSLSRTGFVTHLITGQKYVLALGKSLQTNQQTNTEDQD